MKIPVLATAALALTVSGAPALADPADHGYQLGVALDTFPDRWNLPRRHDDPLVTLPTSRMTLNAHLDNFFRADEGLLFGLDGRIHWGERLGEEPYVRSGPDYEYRGMDLTAQSGYRFGAPGDAVRYDMRFGLGYRGVGGDSRLAGAHGDDDRGTFYTQLSGGPRFSSGSWQGFLEMGVRVPLASDERGTVAAVGEGVEPAGNGRRSAGFVSFQNVFQLSDSSALRLDLYYDRHRYGLSDTTRWQGLPPDDRLNGRDQDVFGFEMGLSF
ncbi:hypothetical protein B1C78_04405 [Thioalkalivibrio denitrificans]|uniref:Outer membrane protein beta-barrel domain-containing protein n=1 Tax=Thioalkalivibrio denitrificans TaxID=108003 RepID=A0A1V3NQ52_9GAMM|nr:hypothetical protein [Thioalkalivibrio denitrificans]OOG27225.1 hypothetical protein B1C78_04405 [Thioalkalivibrio denitrificans]